MSERFMKNLNGEKVFSLEYDKETLRDMVIEKQEQIERLNNIIENIEKYIRYWNRKGISQNTMLILNDILLIKNGMSDKVVRLKEK